MDPSMTIKTEEQADRIRAELEKRRNKAKIDEDRIRDRLISWTEDLYDDLSTDAECDLYRTWVEQCDVSCDDKYAKYLAEEGCQARIGVVKNEIGTRLNKSVNLILTNEDYDDDGAVIMDIVSNISKRVSDLDLEDQEKAKAIRMKLKELYNAILYSEECKAEEKAARAEECSHEECKAEEKAARTIDKDRFRDRLINWTEDLYEDLCTDAECVLYDAFLAEEDCEGLKEECVRYEKYLAQEGRQSRIDATKKEIEKCLNYTINLILSNQNYDNDSTLSTIAKARLSKIKKRLCNLESDNPEPYDEWERGTRKAVKELYTVIMYSEECKAEEKAARAEAAGTVGGDEEECGGVMVDGEMYMRLYNKGMMPFQDGPPEKPLEMEKEKETTGSEDIE